MEKQDDKDTFWLLIGLVSAGVAIGLALGVGVASVLLA